MSTETGPNGPKSTEKRAFNHAAFGAWKRHEQQLKADAALPSRFQTCTEEVKRGTRTEICDMTLDRQGNCPNAGAHLS